MPRGFEVATRVFIDWNP